MLYFTHRHVFRLIQYPVLAAEYTTKGLLDWFFIKTWWEMLIRVFEIHCWRGIYCVDFQNIHQMLHLSDKRGGGVWSRVESISSDLVGTCHGYTPVNQIRKQNIEQCTAMGGNMLFIITRNFSSSASRKVKTVSYNISR